MILISAFFVAAEFAFVKVRPSQLEIRAQQKKSKPAILALKIIRELQDYLSVAQIGITVTSLVLGWVSEPLVAKLISSLVFSIGINISEVLLHTIATPIAFSIVTFIHLIFGELVPKSIAVQFSENVAIAFAYPLYLCHLFFKPIVWLLNKVSSAVLRLFGIKGINDFEHAHSGDELRLLLEQGKEEGTIEQEEHELIENVFEFGEKSTKDIMVPRTNIVSLDIETPVETLIRQMIENGYTRMPVYKDSLDDIVGIVYSKDLIALMEHRNLIIIQDLLRPAYCVPETKPIKDLMREFQKTKNHFAVVIDEFGGTAGLITMEDILEELVGEIQDEYDDEVSGVEKIDDRIFIINASLSISDVNEMLEGIELPEGEDYTTVAGLTTKWFGHIPEANETLDRDGVRMTVLLTQNRRVLKVKVEDLIVEVFNNGISAFDENK
ncbi:MAG: hemolysin family protein [Candidatus Kapaibacterium sp.]